LVTHQIEITDDERIPEHVEEILRSLPEWFGVESALLDYVEQARVLPTYAARHDGHTIGICIVKLHTQHAAEISLLAVDPAWHRRGVGRALMDAVERDLTLTGVEFVQVKTLGPSYASRDYEGTRLFYEAIGYRHLEEIHGLWPDNPCLILIKRLPPAS
jgi:GNAT superfamily N-acetyltransferase